MRSRYVGKQAPPGIAGSARAADQAATNTQAVATTDTLPPLRVRTLGGFTVWRGADAMPASTWARPRIAALFKYLLTAPGHCAQRDYLLEAFWPDEDPALSAGRLRVTVHRLRRVLGETGAGRGYVRTDNESVALVPAPGAEAPTDWLDALAFQQAAAVALAHHDIERCRGALALYAGDYLPDDQYEEWAAARREALRHQYLAVLLRLAELRAGQGEDGRAEAERCLLTVLQIDPTHEPATRALMRVQDTAGRPAEALRTYHLLVDTLRRTLDLAPDTQTQVYYAALLATHAAATLRRTNPPTPLTSFLGGAQHLVTLAALLGHRARPHTAEDDPPTCRLLTLTGSGGCGKTRLATELGRALLDTYRDGVWIVELAALTDAALIVVEVARVVGVREQAHQPLVDTLTTHLKERHLLLILDNCEHLLNGCAVVAAALLGACPLMAIVTTTREALGMLGETVWRVPSLPLADPARLPPPPALPAYAAIGLFVERARAVQPGFVLTAANCSAVARLCYHLDGIPLAIELAAAQLVTLAVDAVAARLDDRFRLLAGGNRAALPRHQTLRAVLDWSYALLDPLERLLLQRLSVFAGGWSREAAEVVCTGGSLTRARIAPLLDDLHRKSLVQREETSPAGPRSRLLETVRQYADEQASQGDERSARRDAHLSWCLSLITHTAQARQGTEQHAWLALLTAEHDNLRAALAWCAGAGQHAEAGLRLATELSYFWERSGDVAEGRRWL